MSTKPSFKDTIAGVFYQLGTIPAEIYLKEIMERLPEGNVVKTAMRGVLKEGKEGIEEAAEVMRERIEAEKAAGMIEVPDTKTVAEVTAGRNDK
jgi:hypothetical protein